MNRVVLVLSLLATLCVSHVSRCQEPTPVAIATPQPTSTVSAPVQSIRLIGIRDIKGKELNAIAALFDAVKENPALILNAGDATHDQNNISQWISVRRIYSRLTIPILHVTGGHDIDNKYATDSKNRQILQFSFSNFRKFTGQPTEDTVDLPFADGSVLRVIKVCMRSIPSGMEWYYTFPNPDDNLDFLYAQAALEKADADPNVRFVVVLGGPGLGKWVAGKWERSELAYDWRNLFITHKPVVYVEGDSFAKHTALLERNEWLDLLPPAAESRAASLIMDFYLDGTLDVRRRDYIASAYSDSLKEKTRYRIDRANNILEPIN